MVLCGDFDRPQWVRIAKVALHYNESDFHRHRMLERCCIRISEASSLQKPKEWEGEKPKSNCRKQQVTNSGGL